MKQVKLDKDISMPTKHGRSIYPWCEMEVGDSFKINVVTSNPTPPPSLIEKGMRFKKFVVTEKGEKIGRIWRVK